MIAIETRRAEGIRHGNRLLVPVRRTVAVRFPGLAGGLVWNRPLAVIVASPDGVEVRPVIDFTKIALAALTAAGFVVAAWRVMKRPRSLFGN